MKKNILAIAIAALTLGTLTVNAQDNKREERRAEKQGHMTERLVKDLKLTDEQKAKFTPIYKNYLNELAALRPERPQVDGQTGASAQAKPDKKDKKEKKELTDAEATAKLQEVFTRQEQQIQAMQQRLDIQKKYCKELSSVLTPKQLLRVFRSQQGRGNQQHGNRGHQGGNMGGPRGGFGGPQGGFPGADL